MDLYRRGYKKDKIQAKIVKFFKAYDLSRDDRIGDLKKKFDTEKKANSKLKNSKAVDMSENAEVENLFLDCIDEWKKEIIRKNTLIS